MYATVSGITNRLLTHVTAENQRGNSAVTAISADFAEDARCQMVGEKMRCHTLYMTEPGTWEKAIKRLMNTGHREKYRIAIHVRDLYVSWAFVSSMSDQPNTIWIHHTSFTYHLLEKVIILYICVKTEVFVHSLPQNQKVNFEYN